jgi:hypothetical protein
MHSSPFLIGRREAELNVALHSPYAGAAGGVPSTPASSVSPCAQGIGPAPGLIGSAGA